jgi:signal recognition particle receptor subunit beta
MYDLPTRMSIDAELPTAERETVVIKFLITGPFAAGKTTLVKTMSEIPFVGTESAVTDDTSVIKTNTTVGMDFGKLTLVEEDIIVELALFGTPGQQRFNFMWDVLAAGMDGYLVLVDLSRPETFAECAAIIEHFRGISDVPFIIGANRDAGNETAIGTLAETLGAAGAPVIVGDATDRESARDMLLTLLEAVLEAVDDDDEVQP